MPDRSDIWAGAAYGLKMPQMDRAEPRDPDRRERGKRSFAYFLEAYCSNKFWSPAPIHNELVAMLQEMVLHRGQAPIRRAWAAPRSIGKTTLGDLACLWAALHRHRLLWLFVGAKAANAETRLQFIKQEIMSNVDIRDDFPEIVGPVLAFHGDPRQAPPLYPWASDRLRLPNDVWICARGIDSALVGLNEGGVRPDFVWLDDVETVSSISSADETKAIDERVRKEVGRLHDINRPAAYAWICTVRARGCISDRVTDERLEPEWRGRRYRALVKPPDALDLWDVFQELCKPGGLDKADKVTLADADMAAPAVGMKPDDFAKLTAGHQAALRFYAAHRPEMDAGAELLDPRRLPLHLIYHALATEGEAVFRCELQNDPPSAEETAIDRRAWDARFIASHSTDYDPLTFPVDSGVTTVTMGADVHNAIIYYVFRGWTEKGTSYLFEAGVADVSIHAHADDTARLQAMQNALMRLWDVSQQGFKVGDKVLGLRGGYVDEGWETDLVRAICARTGRIWRPAKGFAGMRQARLKPEIEARASVAVGIYHFKHDVARLLDKKRGEDGFFHLHNRPAHAYLYHMCSEVWQPKRRRDGNDPEEYEWVTVNRNNHWWDCEVLAAAAAYASGIRFQATERPAPAARPKSMGEPQRIIRRTYG